MDKLTPSPAIALQYYHTAKILLAVADSARVKVGVGFRESHRLLQEEVSHHASLLFGIYMHGEDRQSRLGAVHVISIAAPYIVDKAQQEAIVTLLTQLERDHAWPTRAIAMAAVNEWEWVPVEDLRADGSARSQTNNRYRKSCRRIP